MNTFVASPEDVHKFERRNVHVNPHLSNSFGEGFCHLEIARTNESSRLSFIFLLSSSSTVFLKKENKFLKRGTTHEIANIGQADV